MMEYRAVSSGYEISKKVADLLEDIDPIQYNGSNRVRRVRNVNDYLQGRNDMPLEPLLDWAAQADGGAYAERVMEIRRSIQAFQAQMDLLTQEYNRPFSNQQFSYKIFDIEPWKHLKVVDQNLYDQAVQTGFPSDFFRCAYFDQVTIYCVPDCMICSDSIFNSCKFNVCRLVEVEVWGSSLHDCEFNSCLFQEVSFSDTFLSYTHFYDCDMGCFKLPSAHLRRCSVIGCDVTRLDLLDTSLDGCSFDRISRSADSAVLHLETAHITQGGATEEECARNRAAIFKALGVKDPERSPKRRRPPEPER